MAKYICKVERIQVWRDIEVEATDKESAKTFADDHASQTDPDDDHGLCTTADLASGEEE